jgi:hypothetical protein
MGCWRRRTLFVVLALGLASPARATLIIWEMHGTVGPLNMDVPNPLLSPPDPFFEGDPIDLVVHVDTAALDLCGQPGKGLYLLPFAAFVHDGFTYASDENYVEVNNAGGNCSGPGDDDTGVVIRLLVGPWGMTLFGLDQDGEALPLVLFSPSGVGGFVGLSTNYADVRFDDVQSQEIVPEPATLLLLSAGIGGLAVRRWRRRSMS